MSSDIFSAIRALGTQLAPPMLEGSQALFAPLAPRPTPDVCAVERDIAYGPDARHRLDVFYPPKGTARGPEARPVLAFVHGGGFVRGDKGAPEAPFYNNVGAWAVQNGLIGVTLTYRLAPAARWPAGPEDVATALEWLATNVARFGGNPDRLLLMGQSAGGVHVAGCVAGHHGRKSVPRLSGAIMLSAVYDLLTLQHSQFEHAYFGTDPARFAAASTLEPLTRTEVPCLFTVSELDPPNFQQQAARLVEAFWSARGVWPRLLYQLGHNHISPVLQLGTAHDTLGSELLAFIRRVAS
jgi:acetyl esterase/lipase